MKNGRCPAGQYYCYTNKECRPIPAGFMVDPKGMLRKENGATIDESKKIKSIVKQLRKSVKTHKAQADYLEKMDEANKSGDSSLRDWFSKSKSSDGKPGWVQLGGKYAGKPCARQPGQTTKPKCGSSKMKRNLSKSEEDAAFRRKNRQDPNPDRKGKAINVKTEETIVERAPKYDKQGLDKFDRSKRMIRHKQEKYGISTLGQRLRTGADHNIDNEKKAKGMKEDFTTLPLEVEIPNNIRDFNLGLMFRESLDINSGMLFIFDEVAEQSFHMTETRIPLDIAFITEEGIIESIKELEPFDENPVASDGEVLCALEVNRGWFAENNVEVGDEIDIVEGEKDACYHKVKSRYSVWPSAYASGALVKCRKVGAKNWGNKTKKEEFELDEKCWKGYEKKGMKTMFGKRYPNCVKKEETECNHTDSGVECPIHGMSPCKSTPKGGDGGKPGADKNYVKPMAEAVRLPAKTGNIIAASLNWRGRYYILRMFFPQTNKPTKAEVQLQIDKVYPGARVQSYHATDYVPGQPLLQVAEGAAWTRKAGKNKEGGLNEKGRKSYERENPGSDLKAPSKKVGNPRRASFCARMKGMKKKLTSSKTANDPDSRINKSLRAWNC